MTTMALHPKTSLPRTETTHHRYDRRTKESEMHPIITLFDTPLAYCSMSLPFDLFGFRRQILISLKPSWFRAMANLHADFKVTLTDNGIPDDSPILEYLDWAGIRTKNSLAMFFASDDKITEWTEKFAKKITFGSPEKEIHFPVEDRRKGLLACLIATWNVCRDDFTAARQSKLRLPMTPSPTAPPASTTPATSTDDKIPKTWPKGVYQQLITDYKVSTGNTKTFPEKILLGAEQVVIRMWHEHTVSKNYQAVGLGEIITKRTFTATGSVNSTAKRDKSDKTLVLNPDDHTLVQQEQKDWDPQSMMMILDSLDAIRWAWILIQISNQESIDTYIERFIQLTRKNPQRLANVKEAWDTFSCKTFKQATEEILQDPVTIADILSQPPRKKPKSGKGKDKKGKGKGKTKNRYNIHGRPIPDTSHTHPNLLTLRPFHRQHHRAINITIMAHPLPHRPLSANKPKDITKATRTRVDTSPRPSPSPRNRDSTATGRQHTSQLTDRESKLCCKAFYQNHRSYTLHFSMASVSPNWPCSTSTSTSSRHSPGRLTPFATSSSITDTTNKSNTWVMPLRQTSPHFADNFRTTTPMSSSSLQLPHAKTIHEYEMHHQGSPAAMRHWSNRWQTSTSPFDNTYQHTPFDPWWRMSYPITT